MSRARAKRDAGVSAWGRDNCFRFHWDLDSSLSGAETARPRSGVWTF
jgi:hypothetical protein